MMHRGLLSPAPIPLRTIHGSNYPLPGAFILHRCSFIIIRRVHRYCYLSANSIAIPPRKSCYRCAYFGMMQFLTTFTLSLMKSLDIRSEPAVRLLAEFLDMDSGGTRANAEHFAHGESTFFCVQFDRKHGCLSCVISFGVLLFCLASCHNMHWHHAQ